MIDNGVYIFIWFMILNCEMGELDCVQYIILHHDLGSGIPKPNYLATLNVSR